MAWWRDERPGSLQRILEQAAATLLAGLVAYLAALALGYVRTPAGGRLLAIGLTAVFGYLFARFWVGFSTRTHLPIRVSALVFSTLFGMVAGVSYLLVTFGPF